MSRVTTFLAGASVFFGVIGCSENNFSALENTLPGPSPDIEVTPLSLSFGEVASDDAATRSFDVKNVGDDVLDVTDVVIEVGAEAFTLVQSEVAFQLEPDEVRTFDVVFAPMGAPESTGEAVVYSTDEDEPSIAVALEGLGATPQLVISPDPYDFGQAYIPCSDEVSITLENLGLEPLVIDALDYDSSDGQMVMKDANTYPIVLEQFQSAEVDVLFTAQADLSQSVGVLTVDSTDPRGIVQAEQTGEALYAARVTDSFLIPEDPPVDILFMVDQSCSMDTITAPLGSAFTDFITQLNTVTQGWNIGVVTNDNGCANSGLITSSTPSYTSVFQNAVATGGCSGGYPACETESLLGLAYTALQKAQPGQCNAGFLRPGAMLHIIFVSDEKDQTYLDWPAYSTPYQAAMAAIGFYEGFVSAPNLLKVSAIADIYQNCGDGTGAAGYLDAAQATGGETLDVCTSSWSSKTQDLAIASLTALNEFTLTQQPDLASLEVYIDNVLLTPSEYVYDPVTNTIEVLSQVEGGQDVEIEYGVGISCP